MPVEREPSGRRSVQVEVEVPGTPEQVWAAIATGPGISAWFVPTEVEEREGGRSVSHFGPGDSMDGVATITAWEPPRRFAVESLDFGPEGPPIATEWHVEARSGGSCVVRVVHSFFASSEAWDDQLEGWASGWPNFFRILRLYLTHFPGQDRAALQVMGLAPEPKEAAWAAFTAALGLSGAALGQRVETANGAPSLAGQVEWAGQIDWPEELLLRLDRPAPGLAHLAPHPMDGQVYLSLRVFFYGDQAPAEAVRQEPLWQAWMQQQFPGAGGEAQAE
jgi:uncharacterized protein YndB with AHSA1/START domain